MYSQNIFLKFWIYYIDSVYLSKYGVYGMKMMTNLQFQQIISL